MMRVMNGHRPPRPALVEHDSAAGVYEDALWDWIKYSWHADASVRPLISDISSAILNFLTLQRWPTAIPSAMKIACGIPRGAGGCPGSISMFHFNIHRLLATHLHVHHDVHHSQEQELPAYCTERGCRISQSRTFHLRHTIHNKHMPSHDLPEWPFLDRHRLIHYARTFFFLPLAGFDRKYERSIPFSGKNSRRRIPSRDGPIWTPATGRQGSQTCPPLCRVVTYTYKALMMPCVLSSSPPTGLWVAALPGPWEDLYLPPRVSL
jgi:hypothetical protein